METKLITESDNVKPIAKNKSTGKKEEVIIVPPNPEKDPKRKKEFKEAETKIAMWSLQMDEYEFDALKAGKRFSWIEQVTIYQNFFNGGWHDVEDRKKVYARLYVFNYDSKNPGFTSSSLYLHFDRQLFKPYDISEVSKIIEQLKIIWLFKFERSLTWDAEYEVRKAKRLKEEAENKAQRELAKEAKAKLKAEAPKKIQVKKSKSSKTAAI